MRQKFLEDTIQSKFIKALLYNAYLPTYSTLNTGDYAIKGMNYIYKRNVCICDKSGPAGNGAALRPLKHYTFGLPYPKFSDNFISTYPFYDIETHKRLGQYLRCYRDIYDIDLMPFYNCFTGQYTSGLKITKDGIVNKPNSTDKIFMIPIKFNKTYTICIDSQSEVWMAPAMINNFQWVTIPRLQEDGTFSEVDLTEVLCSKKKAIQRFTSTSFTTPIIYELENKTTSNELFLQQHEKYLYLIIQVSSQNNSSLSVLEGNYTKLKSTKIINAEEFSKIKEPRLNELFLSELSLMRLSDGISYPFADRLIEYLLQNVIDIFDPIKQNIVFAQNGIAGPYETYKYEGIWTSDLRQDIYQKYKSDKKSTHIDNNGFVDKDVERYIILHSNSGG